jgi:hypothetical protein
MKRSATSPLTVTVTVVIALVSFFLMTACADRQADNDPALLARQAIDRAQARHLESQQAGYAWVRTVGALEAAKEAFEADDFPKAISEAGQAAALAETSLAQAKAEQSAWLDRFPKASSNKTSASMPSTPIPSVPIQ